MKIAISQETQCLHPSLRQMKQPSLYLPKPNHSNIFSLKSTRHFSIEIINKKDKYSKGKTEKFCKSISNANNSNVTTSFSTLLIKDRHKFYSIWNRSMFKIQEN